MSEFDIPGINLARQALTSMARTPKSGRGGHNPVYSMAVKELYPEIRAARIAGYPWKAILTVIKEKCNIGMCLQALVNIFGDVDLEYEKSTGVKALPRSPERKGKKKYTNHTS